MAAPSVHPPASARGFLIAFSLSAQKRSRPTTKRTKRNRAESGAGLGPPASLRRELAGAPAAERLSERKGMQWAFCLLKNNVIR